MRAKKDNAVKTTRNMVKAKAFLDGVDAIIAARNEIFGFSIGTMVFMAILIALQFIPVANWLSNGVLALISLVINAGPSVEIVSFVFVIRDYYNASKAADAACYSFECFLAR